MIRLSTATGYLYGYVQDLETNMWQFIMIDFETGETAYTLDVSDKSGYNNMAVGMYGGSGGNVLYCPTGYLEVLRIQDRFAYLPEMPYRKIDLDLTKREIISPEQLLGHGILGTPVTWLHSVTVNNVHPETTVAIKVNGLTDNTNQLTLYARSQDGNFLKVDSEHWTLATSDQKQNAETIYEIHVSIEDNGPYDSNSASKEITASVFLVRS